MNYYEHHIGDYAEATAHLTFIEDAAYSRMIRKYYAQEKPLPADLKAVQRLVGARTKEEREAVDTVLNEFFKLEEDGWHNGRCDAELARYLDKSEGKDTKRENERERQRRHRERRKEMFEALRAHGITPSFDTSTDELVTLLSQAVSRVKSHGVTEPVTRDATATQSPDTSHQTPVVGDTASTQLELGAGEGVEPTAPGVLSIAMRAFGISSNPGDLRLIALADQGVTAESVKAACEAAKKAKPNESISPPYVFAILERWAKEAAELKATGAAQPRQTTYQTPTDKARTWASRITGGNRNDQRDDPEFIDLNAPPARGVG